MRIEHEQTVNSPPTNDSETKASGAGEPMTSTILLDILHLDHVQIVNSPPITNSETKTSDAGGPMASQRSTGIDGSDIDFSSTRLAFELQTRTEVSLYSSLIQP